MVTIDVLGSHRAALGEGPWWDPHRAVLWWVDVVAGELRAFDPATDVERSVRRFDDTLSHVATRQDGGLRVAVGLEVLDIEEVDGPATLVTDLAGSAEEPSTNRCNDGGCDPSGRYWIGTMDRSARSGRGALYRLDPDGPVRVLTGVSISNGIGWNRAGDRMYYIDSRTGSLEVLDHDPATGAAEGRRTHAMVTEVDGQAPDGLTIDDEDGIWVAVWGGGVLHRYDADGALTQVVELPTSHPTSCTFGGSEHQVLYCTTASLHDDQGADRIAGALLALDVGARGRPPGQVRTPEA